MEITTESGRFYVDDAKIVELALTNGINPAELTYAQIASISIPYELYELLCEKARLESIPRITDEHLLEWARANYSDVAIQEANDRNLIEITLRITTWQP